MLNEKCRIFYVNEHLDVRSLPLLSKGQSAQKVEKSADLLKCEVVHVVQNSLHQMLCLFNQAH